LRNFTLNNLLFKVRYFLYICLLIFFTSCEYFSFEKNKNVEKINMDVDYTSVDISPSFKICDSLIDKDKKNICFRTTIREEIANSLSKYSIKVKKPLNETIIVTLIIKSNKEIKLTKIEASESLIKEIPSLHEMMQKSIGELSEIFPAIKRGIPVTTQYKLPIRINLEN